MHVYQTVDLHVKVKIVTKSEKKQVIIQNDKIKYKVDIADETQSMKLVLWENTINKVTTGKSYLLKHLTVCTFEDFKFVNWNESTVIHEVGDIDNINIDNPELKENILTDQCIGVDIKKNSLLYGMQQKSSNRSFR